jgi:hypothetical protein
MKGDRRLFVRGHDFIVALSWYLREHGSKSSNLYRTEVLTQLVFAYVQFPSTEFFHDLLDRLKTS